jgi:glycine hydroxymethyltransferase
MHVIAAKAVASRRRWSPSFKDYQQQVVANAQAMAEVFMSRGYDVVSGGTDNHLFLVSFIEQGLTGKDVDAWLGAPTSPSTRTPCPTIRSRPSSPAASASARRRSPPAASAAARRR